MFFVPALYIVLSDVKRNKYLGKQAGKALMLWAVYFLIFFGTRLLEAVSRLNNLTVIAVVCIVVYNLFQVYKVVME